MVEAYLSLNKKILKETEKEATEQSIKDLGEEDGEKELTYSDLTFDIGELYFDEDSGKLVLNGSLLTDGKSLGYFSSFDIPVDLDLVIGLVQMYMKKLGKLKTVLEATK